MIFSTRKYSFDKLEKILQSCFIFIWFFLCVKQEQLVTPVHLREKRAKNDPIIYFKSLIGEDTISYTSNYPLSTYLRYSPLAMLSSML